MFKPINAKEYVTERLSPYSDAFREVSSRLGFFGKNVIIEGDYKVGHNPARDSNLTRLKSQEKSVQLAQLAVDEAKAAIKSEAARYSHLGGRTTLLINGKQVEGRSKNVPFSTSPGLQKKLKEANDNLSSKRGELITLQDQDKLARRRGELVKEVVLKESDRNLRVMQLQGIKVDYGETKQSDLINQASKHVNSNTNANGKGKRPKLKRPRRR